jgi:ribosomal protein S18 acetylase RimI-like enzyme
MFGEPRALRQMDRFAPLMLAREQDETVIIDASAEPDVFRAAVERFRGTAGDERFLATEGTVSFVAVVDGVVAGWCWGQHMRRPDGASMLYLHELEVAEDFRRRGLGRALVESFMDAGRAVGATKMFLTTGEANVAARGLYEQLGAGLAGQGPTVNYWFLLTS